MNFLLLDLEKNVFEIYFGALRVLPLGPHGPYGHHLNNFESPTHRDDLCQIWLKIGSPILEKKMKM